MIIDLNVMKWRILGRAALHVIPVILIAVLILCCVVPQVRPTERQLYKCRDLIWYVAMEMESRPPTVNYADYSTFLPLTPTGAKGRPPGDILISDLGHLYHEVEHARRFALYGDGDGAHAADIWTDMPPNPCPGAGRPLTCRFKD